MRNYNDPARFVALLVVMSLVLVVAQAGLVSVAFHRLGLSPASALLLLLFTLMGSVVNLPVFRLRHRPTSEPTLLPPPLDLLQRLRKWDEEGQTIVAINLGGALIPVLFSAYLMSSHDLQPFQSILVVTGVSLISHRFSRPIAGMGIAMPVFIAPIAAALFAIIVDPDKSAPLAYVGGSLGVLIGADLLRLRDLRQLGAPLASIGGAGTFDGIYLSGLVAVLLA